MHIPDGLIHPAILLIGWLLAIAGVGLSLKIMNRRVNDEDIPFMALLAAAIFVAQMLNFPVGGGTTGHLVGAALAAILLGPVAAILIIFTILLIQCFIFGDGGITALGLNTFNMAIVGALTGWYVYSGLKKMQEKMPWESGRGINEKAVVFVSAWSAVFLSSAVCALQLAVSHAISGGDYGIRAEIAFPAMLLSHAVIGIGEGIITSGVIAYLGHTAPEYLKLKRWTFASPGSGREVAT